MTLEEALSKAADAIKDNLYETAEMWLMLADRLITLKSLDLTNGFLPS